MTRYKAILVTLILLSNGASSALASDEASSGPASPMSILIQGLIDQSLVALEEGILPIESLQAEDLYAENKALLTNAGVLRALERQATMRKALDDQQASDEDYARQAMQSFKDNLRLTPGVMTLEELRTRAQVMAHIARAQSKVNPQICRYLPSDFALLLDVEPTWLIGMPADTVKKAAADEKAAVKRILEGLMLVDVNDTSKQTTFASFAGEWLAGLDEETKVSIGQARTNGNYCPLWAKLLDDLSRMTAAFPVTGHKLLRPVMLNPPRGWLDSGRWAPVEEELIE